MDDGQRKIGQQGGEGARDSDEWSLAKQKARKQASKAAASGGIGGRGYT